jgi:hypothetical protein
MNRIRKEPQGRQIPSRPYRFFHDDEKQQRVFMNSEPQNFRGLVKEKAE